MTNTREEQEHTLEGLRFWMREASDVGLIKHPLAAAQLIHDAEQTIQATHGSVASAEPAAIWPTIYVDVVNA